MISFMISTFLPFYMKSAAPLFTGRGVERMRNPRRALPKLSTFPKSVIEELREDVGFP